MTKSLYPQKNIVILGAGFGGLAATRILGRALRRNIMLRRNYDLVLVDRHDVHTYTPGLYEVATTRRTDATPLVLKRAATIPLAESLHDLPVRFVQDEILSVDARERRVILRDGGRLEADYLLLALGTVADDLGIPGVRQHALFLKTFEDALRIRARAEKLFHERERLRIVVAGGGATGVELSGELLRLAERESTDRPQLTLVDAGPRLLPGTPAHIAARAQQRLQQLGITVRLNARVTQVEKTEVVIEKTSGGRERLPYDALLWTTGIKPNPVLEGFIAPKDARGRCIVDEDLSVHGYDRVFAVGDLTCFTDPRGGNPLPATAYIAIAEGKLAARNILAHIAGRPLRSFRGPSRPPMVIPISGKWAIAYVFGFTVAGFFGFLVRLAIDLSYFLRALRPWRALRFFVRSALIYFRND